MKAQNKTYRMEWIIGITTSFLSFILPIVCDIIKGKPILSTLTYFFDILLFRLKSAVNFNFPVWIIFIFCLIFYFIKKIVKNISQSNSNDNEFLNYRQDTFKKWKWKWNWKFINNQWIIDNLTPYCPKCGTIMIVYMDYIFGSGVNCPRCKYCADPKYNNSHEYENPHEIRVLIIDHLERKDESRRQIIMKDGY